MAIIAPLEVGKNEHEGFQRHSPSFDSWAEEVCFFSVGAFREYEYTHGRARMEELAIGPAGPTWLEARLGERSIGMFPLALYLMLSINKYLF